MFDQRSIVPKTDRAFLANLRRIAPEDPNQRKLMMAALCLLLLALAIVLWRDRDFWFPDTPEEESDQQVESSPAGDVAPVQQPTSVAKSTSAARPKSALKPGPKLRTKRQVAFEANASAPSTPDASTPVPPVTIGPRTVLPPLEVEVVAGDTHRTVRPGSSSVRVDLQPGTPAQPVTDPVTNAQPAGEGETAANLTSDVAERVEMSANASEIVARPVKPDYPLLARQMRVQGSVILKALIGRDGIIQNLRVVSGPHMLASAAEDAVRQWHFKPHLEGSEAVETEAKITVNFTISTN
jgi:TonB family protein